MSATREIEFSDLVHVLLLCICVLGDFQEYLFNIVGKKLTYSSFVMMFYVYILFAMLLSCIEEKYNI